MLTKELRAAVLALSEELKKDERYIRLMETRHELEQSDLAARVDKNRKEYMELLKAGNEDGNLFYRQKDFMNEREDIFSDKSARNFYRAEIAFAALFRELEEEFIRAAELKGIEQI